jgi:hypothetical protein
MGCTQSESTITNVIKSPRKGGETPKQKSNDDEFFWKETGWNHAVNYQYRGPRNKFGEMDGKGKLSFENGDEYVGEFRHDHFHGDGVYSYGDGNLYSGGYKKSKKHGKGEYKYTSGDMYTGDWFDDKKHGKGTYKFHNGNVYTGDWYRGQMTGKGTYTYENGNVYEGEMKANKKNGQGKFTSLVMKPKKDNISTEGDEKLDELKDENEDVIGKNIYEGSYRNDFRHGKGTCSSFI